MRKCENSKRVITKSTMRSDDQSMKKYSVRELSPKELLERYRDAAVRRITEYMKI